MNTQNTIFGADLGMGAIKLYGPAGGLQILSQVATHIRHNVNGMLGLAARKKAMEITTPNGNFFIGEGAHDWGRPVENLDYDRLTGAPEMNALLYGALAQYQSQFGEVNGPVNVMVGLPLETMLGDEATRNADAVRKWLKGSHIWTVSDKAYQMTVVVAKCTSQPAAAYFDYILGDDGRLNPARRAVAANEVGVMSIGFNTIELLVVRDKAPVQRFTTGNTIGVRRLLELINKERHFSRGELDVMLRNGKLDTREALPIWAREVFGQIETHWGRSFRRFAGVIIVGGGSILLRDQLVAKFQGKAIIPDDPIHSIARGLYKFALARRARSENGSAGGEVSQMEPSALSEPTVEASQQHDTQAALTAQQGLFTRDDTQEPKIAKNALLM